MVGREINLGDFPIGTVVKKVYANEFGHVVGFTENEYKTPILNVVWSDKTEPAGIHPANVIIVAPTKKEN